MLRSHLHDPLANSDEAQAEYGLTLTPWERLEQAHAVVLAVPHAEYRALGLEAMLQILAPNGVVMDVKGVLDRCEAAELGIALWRL